MIINSRRSRRITLLATAAVAGVLALAGCSSGASADPSPSTSGKGSGPVTALITPEQNTGLESYYADFATETGYTFDPTLGNGTVGILPLSAEGSAADLSDQPWASAIPDSYKSLVGADGKIYGFTPSGQAILMFFNKKVFADAGVKAPTTWNEFITVNKKLKAKGYTPISLGLGTQAMVQFIPYQLAATLVSGKNSDVDADMAAGKDSFAKDKGWKEVFTKFTSLIDDGYVTENTVGVTLDAAMQDLAAGKAGMIPLVSNNAPALAAYMPGGMDDLGMFALPATNDPDETFVPLSPEVLAVNAQAKNADGAKAFLTFLSDPERLAEYADATNTIPVLQGVTPVESPLGEALAPFLADQHFTPFAVHLWPNGDVQAALLQSGQLLATGGITVDELLKQMDTAYALGKK
jgi:raffinose/stachyose/melibiose transport system substrate-binding protein